MKIFILSSFYTKLSRDFLSLPTPPSLYTAEPAATPPPSHLSTTKNPQNIPHSPPPNTSFTSISIKNHIYLFFKLKVSVIFTPMLIFVFDSWSCWFLFLILVVLVMDYAIFMVLKIILLMDYGGVEIGWG